ncbi:hypothetical protein D4R52_01905 [bacterium]|nr:MAG: hypothetical protein D4R52_01905 [bacterium]
MRTGLRNSQSGQTLIETIVAIYILTTGLASGLALAIYSFSATADVSEKLVATGLAREGVETIRRMRDSNWKAGALSTCPDLGANQKCHADWLNRASPGYNISGSASGIAYRVAFDPITQNVAKWTLDSGTDYRLYQQADGAYNHNAAGTATDIFRKVTIIYQSSSGDYSAASPLVLVRSAVWWWGRNCPRINDLNSPADSQCKIISEEYLTNWRDY